MLLRGFLLIGFVLNAFCLNNLSGEFLRPKYDLRKNESLVESLEKDPSSFVELFAKADEDTIIRVIGILEALITDASSLEEVLLSKVTDATNNLDTKNLNLVTADTNVENAQVALEQADTTHSNTVIEQTNAVNAQDHAQTQKDIAHQTYAERSPTLLSEQEVLRQVIETLRALKDSTPSPTPSPTSSPTPSPTSPAPTNWNQLGLDIYGEANGDSSGRFIAISSDGSMLAIGAPNNDGNGANSGHVRVFRLTDNSWGQIGSSINGEAAGDQSGTSVALSSDGSIIAVAAPYNDGNGADSGHVRVFRLTDNRWTKMGSDIDGDRISVRSVKIAISSDGSILAVGVDFANEAGHVRVFRWMNLHADWAQIGLDIYAQGRSGSSIALSSDGSILAIGDLFNDGNGANSGHVRVFRLTDNSWSQIGSSINGEAAGDQSGNSIALSSDGSILAVGALNNDGNGYRSGHVRVYRFTDNSWSQLGADIDGAATGDTFGRSVALSSDGSILAAGTEFSDANGENSGQVRVFRLTANSWTPVGVDIDGDAAGDKLGASLALSSSGSIIAIGIGRWGSRGRVRVFSLE